jgi:hypothetical protein
MTATVEELDRAMVEELGAANSKTVRILCCVQERTNLKLEEIADRVYQLVNIGTLECFGNSHNSRYSELRVPPKD